jgi:erythromycin esterase-like protein
VTGALDLIRKHAQPLDRGRDVYNDLLNEIGTASLALIGEASHGTHEFYEERAEITRRLIVDRGFNAVAVEADWPDAYRVNRYVRGIGDDRDAVSALGGFRRFPTWMWRNTVVVDFVEWLKGHNRSLPENRKVGFYGLDLYSLFSSIEAVLHYLDKVDPEAARRARDRYACFEHFNEDSQAYGYAASFGMSRTCEDEVVATLIDLKRRAADYRNRDGFLARDEFFFAEQNAHLIRNAEEYYRSMFARRVSSWNLRDTHMMETLNALMNFLVSESRTAKIAVWAHNSHLGDARATDMGRRGEINLGQLVREKHGDDAWLIGMSTYTGSVTASSDWGDDAERKRVRPALNNSYEQLLHRTDIPEFLLTLRGRDELRRVLAGPLLERAIGVIYRPDTERASHYFETRLPGQFDVLLHIDETRALEPLEKSQPWISGEPPETFPSAL